MNVKALILGAFGMLSLLAGPAHGGWKEIERRDAYQIVVINKKDTTKVRVFWEALRKVCSQSFCNVVFFSEGTPIPEPGKRLAHEDLNRALLIYTTNKGFAWNCRVYPNADNCFRK